MKEKETEAVFFGFSSSALYVETPATTLEQLSCKLEQLAFPLSQGIYIDRMFEFRIGIVQHPIGSKVHVSPPTHKFGTTLC